MTAIRTSPSGQVRGQAYDGSDTDTYDVENRLIQSVKGTTTFTYAYDPLGHRKQSVKVSTITSFVLAGDDEIADFTGSGVGTAKVLTVRGPGGLPAVAVTPANASHGETLDYYHHDGLGTTIADTEAGIAGANQAYTYSDFGLPANTSGLAYRLGGQRYDNGGTSYYYLNARYYSPGLGRFLQPDPIGVAGGPNLYTYVGNDPINGTDPNGTCGPVCLAAALAVGGAVVGITTQFVVDVAINGHISPGGQYISAGLSGAAVGLSVVPGGGALAALAIKVGGGATVSAVGSGLGQYYDTGSVNIGQVAADAVIGGATTLIPGPAISGITAGRNSFSAIASATITKLSNGSIEDLSAQTLGKSSVGLATKSAYGDLATSVVNGFVGGAAYTPAK